MSPKQTIEIKSASELLEKVGEQSLSLKWQEGKVIQATQDALDKLRSDMAGKADAEKQKLAEAFLRSQEQSEATESLEGKLEQALEAWVSSKLKAVVPVAAVAGGATAVVHALDQKAEELTGQKLGIKETIRDWLKEASEKNTFFLGFLWKALYHAFGGKDNEKMSWDDSKNKDANKNKPNEKIENSQNSIVKATAVILAKVSPALLWKSELYKDQKNVATILTMPQILDKKYEDLQKVYQKYSRKNVVGISKELNTAHTDKDVYDTLDLLFADEKMFALLFAPAKWDVSWKQKNISELLLIISKDVKVFDRMEKAAKAASATEFEKLLGSEDESEGIQFEWGNFVGDMKEKVSAMIEKYKDKWLTMRVASDIMINPDKFTEQIMKERGYTDKEIGFINYLNSYSKSIGQILWLEAYGWNRSNILNLLGQSSLSLKETFRFFMYSSDAKSLDEMNVFAQYKTYGYIRSIIKSRNDNKALAGYDLFLFEESKNIVMNSPSKLPDWVKKMMKQMTSGAESMAKNWLEDNLSYGWELIKKEPKLAVVAIGLVAGTFLLGRVVFAGKVATVTLLTLLASIATTMWLWAIWNNLEKESQKAK